MGRMEKSIPNQAFLIYPKKLTFDEIVTIYTCIERADHHGGDGEFSDECRQVGTFFNLYKRLNEIKKE